MGKNEPDHSWVSLGLVLVCVYWSCYFALKLVQWLGGEGMFVFIFICVAIGLAYKGVLKWADKRVHLVFSDEFHQEDDSSKDVPLPFFVKGQVRRRKLDLTRTSNFLNDDVGTKGRREFRGLFRVKRKRR